MVPSACELLLPGLYRFADTCNVYVWAGETESIAIDFGSGGWVPALEELGLPPLRHVLLTHHHRDQAAGLQTPPPRPYAIHAPAGEEALVEPRRVREFHRTRRQGGTPASYYVLEHGIFGVAFDLAPYRDFWWGSERLRFLPTPGHGPHALSVIATVAGRQVIFCGDAAHAGATVWQPYCLEWDHWTGSGALAAWEGVERLAALGMDLLCPSHGPVIRERPRAVLRTLAARLLAFYRAKGSICPGETDAYVRPEPLACGAFRLSPHLYQFGCNGYLLLGEAGEGLVFDPTWHDLDALGRLLGELGVGRVTASVATHYHSDHCDAMAALRERFGATVWLHPRVAEPLAPGFPIDCPWLPAEPLVADCLLPADGEWEWGGYRFRVAPFPGQTWWHAALMAEVDGRRVLFAGDNFQPPSRWNGTGGFSAFNGSRFAEGFAHSAGVVLAWRPHWLACGHGTIYRFRPNQFRKIVRWAALAAEATRALCPTGSLEADYYLHGSTPAP